MAKNFQYRYRDGSNVFFTSDTHFRHDNIIRFCQRPFENVEEMNEKLIENWNAKVPEDGLVFHLGDFAWGGYQDWKTVRERLNGGIVLIKGNHDFKNGPQNEFEASRLFKFVTPQLHIEIENRAVILNHFPFLCYGGTYRAESNVVYQLFGHVHSGPNAEHGLDVKRLAHLFPTQYDVGVDNNNFTPVSWHEVDAIIKEQIKKTKEIKNGETE